MCPAINVVAVLLTGLTAVCAGPALFPHGKTSVYRYYGDVKAGIIEPAAYASQFAVQGTLYIKHDTSDSELQNAYYVALSNVKTGMHNGMAAHYEPTKTLKPIEDVAKVIEKPFMIIYANNGRLEGVKISKDEEAWSKNMKMAIASMLQLDLPNIKIEKNIKPHSFITKESTIHGECWISYDIHDKGSIHQSGNNNFVITKFSSPMNCSGFSVKSFNHVDTDNCQAKSEEPVNVASRRLFEMEKQGENIIIKKLVAHGGSNYFPWNARSEAHYVLTNSTFALEGVVPVAELNLPAAKFSNVEITRDITYLRPGDNYAPDAAVDVTQGRRTIDRDLLITKAKKMLGEAADYLEEDHLEAKIPNWKHGQTINRLLQTLAYMDVTSLESVFDAYESSTSIKDVTIKNIFLGVVPEVGTSASALFTLKITQKNNLPPNTVSAMLSKLPLSIRVPTTALLTQMEDLLKFGDSIDVNVRKSSILCFSSLTYRTFKNVPHTASQTTIKKYLDHFYRLLQSDVSYEMKMTYLMAIQNIEVGRIYELLAPIIRGDLDVSEKPEHIRLLAIWAIKKAIKEDYHYAHDLLWPVMADTGLPVKLRIAAYEILMHNAPTMTDVLHLYWFMVYEPNEHLYNYHYTTIKGIANSVDPCHLHLRELVRKIMRFTRVHETIHYAVASAKTYDYKDEKYNHAEKLLVGTVVNEITGIPEVIQLEHTITNARKPYNNMAIRLHIQGLGALADVFMLSQVNASRGLNNPNVLNILKKAAEKIPISKDIHIDMIMIKHGRVISAHHYNEKTMKKLFHVLNAITSIGRGRRFAVNFQMIDYQELYEKQVTSDMGLPVVFETRIPLLISLRLNFAQSSKRNSSIFDIDFVTKVWRHGDYSISIYNTMSDVWHAIRRTTATDVNIPLRGSIIYNSEKQNLTISYPRLPATKFSVAGVRTHARDCVTVNEDDAKKLKESCPSCEHVEDVSRGSDRKKEYKTQFDCKDTGLQYTAAIFDCENGVTPVSLNAEWYRAIKSERKNDWDKLPFRVLMALRQQEKNIFISPQMGSCGGILKIQPSVVHATSHIDMSLRTDFKYVSQSDPIIPTGEKYRHNIHGRLNVFAAATTTIVRTWDFNAHIDVNQGHTKNIANIQLTRQTPGETNLKICIDAESKYPAVPGDPLKLRVAKEETTSVLTIVAGRTNADECVRDGTFIKVVTKGELSNEQRKLIIKETESGSCNRDIKNPIYSSPKNIVPKTLSCINEAIRDTALRNYTIDVNYKKVPKEILVTAYHLEDILRAYFLPNLKYTLVDVEPERVNVAVEFSMEKPTAGVSVLTPDRSYDLHDISFERPLFNGFGPVIKPVWHLPLINTRFTVPFLIKYIQDSLKVCSVYSHVVLTGDGKDIPFSIGNNWTLISGDHFNQHFAVFGKINGNNMAIRVYSLNYQVDIIPNEDNSVEVTVDRQAVGNLYDPILVPNDSNRWLIKLVRYNDHTIVQMRNIPLIVIHGINHVALTMETTLQGKVSGLCGHLDGTYSKGITEVYTMPDP